MSALYKRLKPLCHKHKLYQWPPQVLFYGMITVDLVDSSFPFSNSCALRVKSCWEGFSPPIAPQRHMMLVGGDPLPGQNGSGPCSPSILVTALTHPLPYFSLNMSPSIFFKKNHLKQIVGCVVFYSLWELLSWWWRVETNSVADLRFLVVG